MTLIAYQNNMIKNHNQNERHSVSFNQMSYTKTLYLYELNILIYLDKSTNHIHSEKKMLRKRF